VKYRPTVATSGEGGDDLRPKPILRIIKTMLEDKDVCARTLREGYEFFKSHRQRKDNLGAATSVAVTAAPVGA
jgi:hypothetical protein